MGTGAYFTSDDELKALDGATTKVRRKILQECSASARKRQSAREREKNNRVAERAVKAEQLKRDPLDMVMPDGRKLRDWTRGQAAKFCAGSLTPLFCRFSEASAEKLIAAGISEPEPLLFMSARGLGALALGPKVRKEIEAYRDRFRKGSVKIIGTNRP